MRKSTKGFYTLETAIFLPLVILTVLSLGYFMRIDGMWENCIHGAVDESSLAASKSYGTVGITNVSVRVKSRIEEDNPDLKYVEIKNLRMMYTDAYADNLTSYTIEASKEVSLPLGFQRQFDFSSGIKFRGFTGKKNTFAPMGNERLETYADGKTVWIFPHSGEKYHGESCTYVKTSAEPTILTESVKRKYENCDLCNSSNIESGSIVFCFKGEDTAYHRGTCACIKRRTVTIDKTEAVKRGYAPCSKCGGG